jgi:hypothetical protein
VALEALPHWFLKTYTFQLHQGVRWSDGQPFSDVDDLEPDHARPERNNRHSDATYPILRDLFFNSLATKNPRKLISWYLS